MSCFNDITTNILNRQSKYIPGNIRQSKYIPPSPLYEGFPSMKVFAQISRMPIFQNTSEYGEF